MGSSNIAAGGNLDPIHGGEPILLVDSISDFVGHLWLQCDLSSS